MKNLSIIIPIYNTEKYLPRCLDSICLLKHDISVILIDDGSTDDSGVICDSYARKYNNFKVIHKDNEGLVLARQMGIDIVRTEFFTFIDSDDYIDAKVYDKMLDDLLDGKYTSMEIVCTGMVEEYLCECYPKYNSFAPGVYRDSALDEILDGMLSKGEFFSFGILPNAVCKIFNTDFVRNNPISISPNVKIGEDADMTFQYLTKAKNVLISNYTPYHYCRRDDSMMWKEIELESIASLENDLKNAFFDMPIHRKCLMQQLNDYIDFVSLLCNPKRIFDKDPFFLDYNDRIALYGAGGVGKALKYGMNNNFPIWVDKNYRNYNNDEILPVERLLYDQDEYDKVFIANSSVETCKRIKESLIDLGIRKPIYYYRSKDIFIEQIK